MNVDEKMILPEVVEAVAKCRHDRAEADVEHLSQGEFKPRPWETLSKEMRASCYPAARAFIAAALNAWTGAAIVPRLSADHVTYPSSLILPMLQGARDGE